MKIRYLPIEDRQNLRVLRHTTDKKVIIALLESIFRRPYYTLQVLWEYRKWFMELSEDELREHPALASGLAQICVFAGELDKANRLIEGLPADSIYSIMSQIMLPGRGYESVTEGARRLKGLGLAAPALTLTAARPTVRNGIWDMTPYTDKFLNDKDDILDLLSFLYPESYEYIYDIICAEALYQQNDCYQALVKVVSTVPFLKEKQDMRILFAALTLQTYILLINGQASSAEPLIEGLKQQIHHAHLDEYLPNIDALEAWSAMYDGDYAKVTRWLREGAPDEHAQFCMLDLFRYMIKLRAYIIAGKHMAVTALAGKLLPMLRAGNRYMDTCELQLLWAMSDHADGREQDALARMDEVLALAERYRYDRLIADEGKRALDLLKLYRRERGGNDYLKSVIKLAEDTAALHPRYLKSRLAKQPALTETEMKVLRLIASGCSNAEVADHLGVATDTVKQHCKHIFAKLGVGNRNGAVMTAIEHGLIEPIAPGKAVTV